MPLRRPMPEPEGPLKAWLRSLDLVGRRAYLGPPDDPTYPFLAAWRIGGGRWPGDAPVAVPLMQIDLVGDPARRGKDRYDLAQLGADLCTEIESLGGGSFVFGGVSIDGGEVQSGPLWLPDPIDEDPGEEQSRYAITAEFVMRAVSAA